MRRWFGEYLEAFSACGRGEVDTRSLLEYYGVQQQVDGMRAAAYCRSEILGFEVTVLNPVSAL